MKRRISSKDFTKTGSKIRLTVVKYATPPSKKAAAWYRRTTPLLSANA